MCWKMLKLFSLDFKMWLLENCKWHMGLAQSSSGCFESLWLIIYSKDRRSSYIWICVCISRSSVGVLWVVKWKASICSRPEKLSPFSLSWPFWLLTMSRAVVVRLLAKVLIARKPGKSVTSLLSSQSASGPPGSEAPGVPLALSWSTSLSHVQYAGITQLGKRPHRQNEIGGTGLFCRGDRCSASCTTLLSCVSSPCLV